MKRKKIILLGILGFVLLGGLYAWKEYNRKVKDLSKTKAEMAMKASDLIGRFEQNEGQANSHFLDKIIAVSGTVKAIEKNHAGDVTVVLGEEEKMLSVRCSMDNRYLAALDKVTEGTAITMKGACTGFNRDDLLGSDVVLNRCVVQQVN